MNNYNADEIAVIVLDGYQELEYKHKQAILALYKKPADIFVNSSLACEYITKSIDGQTALTVQKSLQNGVRSEYVEFTLSKLEKRGVRAYTYLSEGYPSGLDGIPYKPLVLYAKGDISLLEAKHKIAMVGSRKTMSFILKTAEGIAAELAGAGVAVITGSAVGGDRSALLGALTHGKAVSVLAHGHDYLYPQTNRTLVERVAEQGLVVSEYPPEISSAPWRYPMRNRLIAALSDACFIISGGADSGTRHTAKFAEAYSKRIYAFPYLPNEASGEICNGLIKMGKAQLVESAFDIASGEGVELDGDDLSDYSEEEIEILSVMQGQTNVDDIVLRTGKKSFEVLTALSMLEIKGAVARGSGNSYTVIVKLKKQ